ncbi:short-chain dehydrogenase [Sporanaerobium hydrogeniformans]|uniref:Short-chain dehydrogenase n=1 Tax=Sporanaerobium hydrogeniformans TaxID=3072179 RepID=A0AC61DBL2_9FIRM|nr:glucose 1-dehydrogenase [Sporanaerobium hydrogeniformans]PHV70325.1 short-chain dehydrogenase [Sporanaerobium hydrogeniformans]
MLKGKVAVITGGTRGIGLEIARKYLQNNATVIVFGSRQESADQAYALLCEEFPNASIGAMAPNLSDYNSMKEALTEIRATYGSLDIMVNNAGISASDNIYEYDPENFENIMDLNVNAVFYGSRVAAAIMKEQGGGVILNTSSIVSLYGQPSGCGYPASKFAVNGLTQSLARELGKDNIRVNAIAPGVTETDMMKAVPQEVIKPILSKISMARIGKPEEVANAFLFLASDMASYITGVVLPVDGATII